MERIADWLRSSRRQVLRCRRGATAVEFALTAPVVFLFVIGIIEVSMIFFINVLLEGSIRESARFGITGYSPPGTSREEAIREIIADKTLGLVDMSSVQIDHMVYETFEQIGTPEPFSDQAPYNGVHDPGEPYSDINGNGTWDPDMGAAGLGGPGDVVVYTVSYDWPLLTGMLTDWIGVDGRVPLRASVAVRNEPYGAASQGGS